ncbi:MAG: hypothetical protein RL235_791 [Chlamydiota bacterium]|jgi:hypothetical protein
MKQTITHQQLMSFRQNGKIQFEGVEVEDKAQIATLAEKKRDLWRSSPFLKTVILQMWAPLVIELTKARGICLACDQWYDEAPVEEPIDKRFGFQGLIAFTAYSWQHKTLDVVTPSVLITTLSFPCYVVAFGSDICRYILNPLDPYNQTSKRLGYAYGDRLNNQNNPFIYP